MKLEGCIGMGVLDTGKINQISKKILEGLFDNKLVQLGLEENDEYQDVLCVEIQHIWNVIVGIFRKIVASCEEIHLRITLTFTQKNDKKISENDV